MAFRYLLSIDTSCDDSSVAIYDFLEKRIVADEVISHVAAMQRFGGVVPEVASREHLVFLPRAIDQALKKADIRLVNVGHIAVTSKPGLIGSLLVGLNYAKTLAYSLNIPFSVIDHVESHLYSPFLVESDGGTAPAFPWIALVVSGGHTDLYRLDSAAKQEWLGGTLDDAAGEAFDKIGKLLGLPYPAGPYIDKWIRESATAEDRKKFAFPRARLDDFAFSFSGLKTAVANQIQKLREKLADEKLAIVASAQEAIVDVLCEQIKKAQEQFGIEQVVVTGGVACNSRLRARLPNAYFPAFRHCSDNAAMVAMKAVLDFRENNLTPAPLTATAHASR